jgi:malonyl-CoA decarboxylase
VKSFRSVAAAAFNLAKPLVGDGSHLDVDQLREEMAAVIEGRGGDIVTRKRTLEISKRYAGLGASGRRQFFEVLAGFNVDRAEVDAAIAAVESAPDAAERADAERKLRDALVPSRVRLLRAFNSLPSGVKFLVEMRADMLDVGKTAPDLRPLATDLKELLASWFDLGFLDMRRISWDAPASLLEKLGRYEAVHEVRGWLDLKNRLDVDRRCFAFMHPAMPDEPLIFVEVALTTEMTGEMASLLDQRAPTTDPAQATNAIFYSISNCQRGLNGISFGDFLIKRVVDALAAELPRLKVFATLSPVPGFRAWLAAERQRSNLLLLSEAKVLAAALGNGGAEPDLLQALEQPDWQADSAMAAVLREPLLRLCAQYLVLEKGRSGRAADPVAHFHLTNGARVERLDWLGDTSEKGLQQSAGIMVNYLYRLDHIEANHEAYRGEGRVAASSTVRHLLRNR